MVISRRKRAVLSKWTLQKKCKDILSFTRGWRTNTPAASLAASAADHMTRQHADLGFPRER